METLLTLTLSGSALALLLLTLRYLVLRRMPSTVYYYAWLLVLLRFALPLPGMISTGNEAEVSAPAVWNEVRLDDRGMQTDGLYIPETASGRATVLPQMSDPSTGEQNSAAASKKLPAINWRAQRLWLSVWAIGAALSFGLTVLAYLRYTLRLRRELHSPDRFTRSLYASIPGRKPALFVSDAVGFASPGITRRGLQPRR
jgi:BlaR1 peptidase M56.